MSTYNHLTKSEMYMEIRQLRNALVTRDTHIASLIEDNKKLKSQVDQGAEARREAQIQLDELRRETERYGLMLSAALQGKRHPGEPDGDGRLDAVRAVVVGNRELRAHVERLRNGLSDAGVEAKDSGDLDKRLWKTLSDALNETPAQSLRSIQAEAVEQYGRKVDGNCMAFEKLPPHAYAQQLRAGETDNEL